LDNFHVDVTAVGRDSFDLAMRIAFGGKFGRSKATHFTKDQNGARIVLFWTNANGGTFKPTPFPTTLDWKAAADVVWHWLETEAPYPREPSHDGDNKKGFRVHNDDWGHIKEFGWESFLAIEPAWAMYGK